MFKARDILYVMIVVFAAAAHAGVGSVISSFDCKAGYRMFVQSIYRDANYLYAVVGDYTNNKIIRLYKYTPSGSFLSVEGVLPGPYPSYGDADHSVRGPRYCGVVYEKETVRDVNLDTGSIASSWSPRGDILGYGYFPNGTRKYVLTEGGKVYRYTAGGSLIGSFAAAGGKSLAVTDRFLVSAGQYVVVAHDYVLVVYTGAGSRVRSFSVRPAPRALLSGAVCGPGYPGECGPTLWCHYWEGGGVWTNHFVYQISLGNGIAVEPTSVGRIKALFR